MKELSSLQNGGFLSHRERKEGISLTENEIRVEKDDENERPIPSIWRPTFCRIVDAFVKKDSSLRRISRPPLWI